MGVLVADFANLDRKKKEQNCARGLEACQQLKIEPFITATEMSHLDYESIGLMATLIQFRSKLIKKLDTSPNEIIKVIVLDEKNEGTVGKPVNMNDAYYALVCFKTSFSNKFNLFFSLNFE